MNSKIQYKDDTIAIMMELLRAAVLCKKPDIPQDSVIDWDRLMDLAAEQCLISWIWEGICKLPEHQKPSRSQLIGWHLSAQEVWSDYNHKKQVLRNILQLCDENGLRMLLLKGISLSELYPNPYSRPSGDIDVYLLDNQYEKGNQLFFNGSYSVGGKHSYCTYEGVMVENHMSIIDINTGLQRKIERYLENSLSQAIRTDEGYWLLAPFYQLLYLLIHTLCHVDYYSLYSLPIRNIIDFGLYIKTYGDVINPFDFKKVLDKFGLGKSFQLILGLSEYVLDMEFHQYHYYNVSKMDINNMMNLIFSKDITPQLSQKVPYFKQVRIRLKHYRRVRWLFKYLPYSRFEYWYSIIRREINFMLKKILNISSKSSLRTYVRRAIIRKQ